MRRSATVPTTSLPRHRRWVGWIWWRRPTDRVTSTYSPNVVSLRLASFAFLLFVFFLRVFDCGLVGGNEEAKEEQSEEEGEDTRTSSQQFGNVVGTRCQEWSRISPQTRGKNGQRRRSGGSGHARDHALHDEIRASAHSGDPGSPN